MEKSSGFVTSVVVVVVSEVAMAVVGRKVCVVKSQR